MRKVIKVSDVRKLAALDCTYADAAGYLGISQSTFSRKLKEYPRLQEAWDQGRAIGRVSLRRKQYNLATTSAPMAIHLGKVILGQDDKKIVEHQGDGLKTKIDLSTLDADNRDKLRQLLTSGTD